MPPSFTPLPRDEQLPQLENEVRDQIAEMMKQKGLGWMRLRTLYTVNECGSMYQAARELYLSSGVSTVRNRIRTLEKDLGLILLISDGTGSQTTKAGMAVLALVKSEFSKS
ncbi:LysR family transcriptional regulator [Fimbriiglobus ruber]|uniref:helix-turn-helix domain-containing protein n=1 Tax=Fimbriiglobus ruber TaxID=1908690 RepID=UPI000B4BCC3B